MSRNFPDEQELGALKIKGANTMCKVMGMKNTHKLEKKPIAQQEELKIRLIVAYRPCSEVGLEGGLVLRIVNKQVSLKARDIDENS